MSGILTAAAGIIGGGSVGYTGRTIEDTNLVGGSAQATLEFDNDGTIDEIRANEADTGQNWITPPSAATASYEVRFDVNSGSLSGGVSTGVWHALGSDRQVFVSQSGAGTTEAGIRARVRLGSTTLEDQNFTLRAVVS